MSIRVKLFAAVVLPLILLWGASLWISFPKLRDQAVRQMTERLAQEAQFRAARFEGDLQMLAQIAKTCAGVLEARPDASEAELYRLVTLNVSQHELVYGSCIAFEPGSRPGWPWIHAPYAFRGPEATDSSTPIRTIDLAAEAYDYSSGRWEWFTTPRETHKPVWTEPYFDKGAGNVVMCTYSVPFFVNGAFRGVVTVDVRLDSLQSRLRPAVEADTAVAILSRRGTFISWPEPEMIMNRTIFDVAAGPQPRPDIGELGRRMIAGASGTEHIAGKDGTPLLIAYAPIPHAGWSYGAIIDEQAVMAPVYAELRGRVAVAGTGVLLGIFIVLGVSWWLTRPVERLAGAVAALGRGDLDVRVPESASRDELGELSRAFNRMTAQLKEHVEARTRETAARQAVESELRVAREIQTSLLPRRFPPFPGRPEFDLHAHAATARQVGGDFFDFWLVGDETLALVIADVSGKGVPAAMFMAVTRTLLRNLAMTCRTPAEILERANAILLRDNEHGMFVTVFLGFYDTFTGRIRYANAGHPAPLLVRGGDDGRPASVERFGTVTGTVLGAIERQRYTVQEGTLQPGDRLVFYTDGVTEARGPNKSLYGSKALAALLAETPDGSARALCERVVQTITAYQNGELADDATVMVLKRTGALAAVGAATAPFLSSGA